MSTSAKNTRIATITENDPHRATVVARDPQPPWEFYYSVTTTGVYCRPSRAARFPKPEKSGVNFNSPSYDDPGSLARDLQDQFPRANLTGGNASFERLAAKVAGFVDAPALGLDLPLDVRGTAFQPRVWQSLRKIPVGPTAGYMDIAKLIGSPKWVRAVAQACGANALAVAIPCHRVVRSHGTLSGYRWGVEPKRALLHKEAHA
ncbi:MAG TPA: methylated-DNA--[protein]-cysteine S-methyltransferase [Candidatus Acidoferrales bacterium]|jgi:O-6-methylguanine DNA methyltransferase|nr:methylated-DNA--[protein]-cysteine S-methyltransferase [Candidatus Acidoferrales bacterium]